MADLPRFLRTFSNTKDFSSQDTDSRFSAQGADALVSVSGMHNNWGHSTAVPLKREKGGTVVTSTIHKVSGQDAPGYPLRAITDESGFSLKGCIIFLLFVALSVFLAIHLIRPSYCSGRFKTEIEGIAVDGFSKSDKEIADEIRSQAEKLGIVVGEQDVGIYWGPGRESVNIKIDYSYPVDLLLCRYNRQYSYEINKRLSYPKRMIDQTNEKLQGSQHRMLEKARKAREKLED